MNLLRRSDFAKHATIHYGDTVSQSQRLLLIVRNVDGRDAYFLLDTPDLCPERAANGSI